MRNFICLLVFLAMGCNDDDSSPFCPDGTCSTEIFPNSSIEIKAQTFDGLFIDIIDGDNLVFRRTHHYDDDKEIIDDELTEILVFQVPGNADSFFFEDQELTNASVLFGRFCYCGDAGYHPVTSGTISGELTSPGFWKIKANLRAASDYADYDIIFEETIPN